MSVTHFPKFDGWQWVATLEGGDAIEIDSPLCGCHPSDPEYDLDPTCGNCRRILLPPTKED